MIDYHKNLRQLAESREDGVSRDYGAQFQKLSGIRPTLPSLEEAAQKSFDFGGGKATSTTPKPGSRVQLKGKIWTVTKATKQKGSFTGKDVYAIELEGPGGKKLSGTYQPHSGALRLDPPGRLHSLGGHTYKVHQNDVKFIESVEEIEESGSFELTLKKMLPNYKELAKKIPGIIKKGGKTSQNIGVHLWGAKNARGNITKTEGLLNWMKMMGILGELSGTWYVKPKHEDVEDLDERKKTQLSKHEVRGRIGHLARQAKKQGLSFKAACTAVRLAMPGASSFSDAQKKELKNLVARAYGETRTEGLEGLDEWASAAGTDPTSVAAKLMKMLGKVAGRAAKHKDGISFHFKGRGLANHVTVVVKGGKYTMTFKKDVKGDREVVKVYKNLEPSEVKSTFAKYSGAKLESVEGIEESSEMDKHLKSGEWNLVIKPSGSGFEAIRVNPQGGSSSGGRFNSVKTAFKDGIQAKWGDKKKIWVVLIRKSGKVKTYWTSTAAPKLEGLEEAGSFEDLTEAPITRPRTIKMTMKSGGLTFKRSIDSWITEVGGVKYSAKQHDGKWHLYKWPRGSNRTPVATGKTLGKAIEAAKLKAESVEDFDEAMASGKTSYDVPAPKGHPFPGKNNPTDPATYKKRSDRDILSLLKSAKTMLRKSSGKGKAQWKREVANLEHEAKKRGLKESTDLEERVSMEYILPEKRKTWKPKAGKYAVYVLEKKDGEHVADIENISKADAMEVYEAPMSFFSNYGRPFHYSGKLWIEVQAPGRTVKARVWDTGRDASAGQSELGHVRAAMASKEEPPANLNEDMMRYRVLAGMDPLPSRFIEESIKRLPSDYGQYPLYPAGTKRGTHRPTVYGIHFKDNIEFGGNFQRPVYVHTSGGWATVPKSDYKMVGKALKIAFSKDTAATKSYMAAHPGGW